MNKYEYRMSNAALGQSFALSDIARQMGRMTDSVSYGAEKIAESNKFIATSISASALFMYHAVASIPTEMKKKRETDEYYLLTDRIDSLHEKIIQNGGNLLEIYQKMTLSVRVQDYLSDVDLRFISAFFADSEDWFIRQCQLYEKGPTETMKELFKVAKFEHSRKFMNFILLSPGREDEIYNRNLTLMSDYKIDFGYLEDNCWNYKGRLVPARNYGGYSKDRDEIYFDEEMRLQLYEDVRQYFSKELQPEFPATDQQIDFVTKINNFVDEMNWQIVLNNLRTLYSELRDAYTKLLVNNSQKK